MKSGEYTEREETMRELYKTVKGFLVRISKDNVSAYAAQSAYFILLSVIPFLLLLMTLVRYTPITKEAVSYAVLRIIPEEFQGLVKGIINEVYTRSSAVLPISAATALWSAGKGLQALNRGLNIIYGIHETRNYVLTRLRSIFYTLLVLLSIVLTMVLLVFGNSIQKALERHIPVIAKLTAMIISMRTAITLAVLAGVFLMIYKFLPNRRATFKSQFPGAMVSSVAWALFSFGFSLYLDYFPGFSIMYGSLATIVLVMLWMYFCMMILLVGAEINAYFEDRLRQFHQAARERIREEYLMLMRTEDDEEIIQDDQEIKKE